MTFKRLRTLHYDDPDAVGQRILEARSRAKISQRQLAFPGCSAAYISRIENGQRVPSLQVLRVIADRLATTEERLAYGDSELDADVLEAYRAVVAACHDGEGVADAYTT